MPARMDDFSHLGDFPSPSSSQYYLYANSEHHVDHHGSQSQSPSNTPLDMSYLPDYSNLGAYPSPERDEDEEETVPSSSKGTKPAAKRKRENRYKNAPPAVLSRRRAQNRASQRAYRERKDQRIKDLETMLNDAKQRNEQLSHDYEALYAEYVHLKTAQLMELQHEQEQQRVQQQHQVTSYGAGGELIYDPPMVGLAANHGKLEMDMFAMWAPTCTPYPCEPIMTRDTKDLATSAKYNAF